MKSGAVFKSNTSQTIRLPKDVAPPKAVKRVDIIPVGRGRLIVPARAVGIVGSAMKV